MCGNSDHMATSKCKSTVSAEEGYADGRDDLCTLMTLGAC